jgi:peptidyl-prolyl cis-trans isomerase C
MAKAIFRIEGPDGDADLITINKDTVLHLYRARIRLECKPNEYSGGFTMPNHIHRLSILSIVALFLLLCAGPLWCAASSPTPPKKAQLASVNGKEILRQDLEIEIKNIRKRYEQQGRTLDEAEIKEAEKNVIENLIIQEVLVQEAAKKKITVDEAEVAKVFDRYGKQFPDKVKFNAFLAELGLTQEKLRTKVIQGLTIQKLLKAEVVSKIKVVDEDCKRFYEENPQFFKTEEEVRASHILIQIEPDTDEAKKKAALSKIEAIKEKVGAGEDFAELAKTSSEGPSSTNGGDLGFFSRGKMVKPFSDAAFAMQKGEVSDIVETRFGYHLIKVTDRKAARTVAFQEAKPKIMDSLKKQEEKNQVKSYIEDLKKQAQIKRFE